MRPGQEGGQDRLGRELEQGLQRLVHKLTSLVGRWLRLCRQAWQRTRTSVGWRRPKSRRAKEFLGPPAWKSSPRRLPAQLEPEMQREVPAVNSDAAMAVGMTIWTVASVVSGLMAEVVPVHVPLVRIAIVELRTVILLAMVIGWVR